MRRSWVLPVAGFLGLMAATCGSGGTTSAPITSAGTTTPVTARASGAATSAAVAPASSGDAVLVGVHASERDGIYTIAGAGGEMRPLVAPGDISFCCYFAPAPAGDRLLVAAPAPDGRVTTAILGRDGREERRLALPAGAVNLEPGMFSADGSVVALGGFSESDGTVAGAYIARAADLSGIRRITRPADGREDIPFAFSPDGSSLLASHVEPPGSPDPPPQDLYAVRVDGSSRIRLNLRGTVTTNVFGAPGGWSPDGRRIAFAARETAPGGRSAVFVVGADGAGLRRITPWGTFNSVAQWSPDGRWIVYDQHPMQGGAGAVFVVHADGTRGRQLTDRAAGGACCATWSQDGVHILYQGSDQNVWTMLADGSGQRKLTHIAGEYDTYVWPAR